MNSENLSLEEILNKTKELGIFVDLSFRAHYKWYQFILDRAVAEHIFKEIVAKFKESSIYGIVQDEVRNEDGGLSVKLGYRRRDLASNNNRYNWIKTLGQDIVMGSSHYTNLNYFATVSISDGAFKQHTGKERKKVYFIIDSQVSHESKDSMLFLFRNFYSAFKT